jgi:hypothetical protein
VLKAVGCCHHNNIVHRDIKPENVLIRRRGGGGSGGGGGGSQFRGEGGGRRRSRTQTLQTLSQTLPPALSSGGGTPVPAVHPTEAAAPGGAGAGRAPPSRASLGLSLGAGALDDAEGGGGGGGGALAATWSRECDWLGVEALWSDVEFVLGDFGFAQRVSSERTTITNFCGTLAFMAPEMQALRWVDGCGVRCAVCGVQCAVCGVRWVVGGVLPLHHHTHTHTHTHTRAHAHAHNTTFSHRAVRQQWVGGGSARQSRQRRRRRAWGVE